MKTKTNYFWNILVGADIFINTLTGGDTRQTISARLATWGTHKDRGFRRRISGVICGLLEGIDPGHCARELEREEPTPTDTALTQWPYRSVKTDEITINGNNHQHKA